MKKHICLFEFGLEFKPEITDIINLLCTFQEVPDSMMLPPPRRFSAAPSLTCASSSSSSHRHKASSTSSSSLHQAYSVDSSESMITVIPASRNFDFKRSSRGSLTVNDGIYQNNFATSPTNVSTSGLLSPRSPTRSSPGALTPVSFDAPILDFDLHEECEEVTSSQDGEDNIDDNIECFDDNTSTKNRQQQDTQSSSFAKYESERNKRNVQSLISQMDDWQIINGWHLSEDNSRFNLILVKTKVGDHDNNDDNLNENNEDNQNNN